MELMEIILLVIGIGVFVVSFLLPVAKEADLKSAKELARGEIRQMVTEEMNQIRQQVDDTVEEAITYAMEKTERSLSRISNEKIMAVNEYSDTVLAEINKNHQEVMFLYDMLNDKHVSLKKTVTAVEKKAKEAEAIAQEAFQTLKPQKLEPVTGLKETVSEKKAAEPETVRIEDFYRKSNSNEAILALYKQGKDKVQIAKELGLGVGEVELVIGLFKERKL